MTIQNQARIKEIYESLKSDLKKCVKYHRKWHPELVKEYFNSDKRDDIQAQLQVICKPFSDIQKIQISKVIAELHTFYFVTNNPDDWRNQERATGEDSWAWVEEQS